MKNKAIKVIRIAPEPTREDANAVITECTARVRAYVQAKLAEHGTAQPVCDLSFGLMQLRSENPYKDIINNVRYINNALIAGWGLFFEVCRLRRELEELKGRTIEIVDPELIADALAIDELTREAETAEDSGADNVQNRPSCV